MYYDSHTHLNEDRLFADRKLHLQQFIDVGGRWLINVGVDAVWNRRAVEIARESMVLFRDKVTVKATIGTHPSEVSFEKITSSTDIKDAIKGMKELFYENKNVIAAIGECGIDAHYPNYNKAKELQQELFDAHCQFARDENLPLVIHSRDQFADTLEVIKNYTDLKIYFHCRGYGPDELEILHTIFPNLRIWFCGNITYPNAEILRASFKKCIALSAEADTEGTLNGHKLHYLLETDAPYLTPQKNRGQLNTPVQVVDTYEYVAQILGKPLSDLQIKVKDSFEKLFLNSDI